MDVRGAWRRLQAVRGLAFEAQTRSPDATGWNGVGNGAVRVEPVDALTMLFHERGSWTPEGGRPINFSNVYRWTLAPDGRAIRLEHLRFGQGNPVYLFDLVPVSEGVLESSEPHVWREDLYAARLEYDQVGVRLNWTINGPKKDETIAYTYT